MINEQLNSVDDEPSRLYYQTAPVREKRLLTQNIINKLRVSQVKEESSGKQYKISTTPITRKNYESLDQRNKGGDRYSRSERSHRS